MHPKREIFLFEIFGFMILKSFIIQDDKIINKILSGTEKFKKADKMITLAATKFSAANYEKLNKKEVANLNATANDLFHFNIEFGKLKSVREEVAVCFIDDHLQSTETDLCGIFQPFFYESLFTLK